MSAPCGSAAEVLFSWAPAPWSWPGGREWVQAGHDHQGQPGPSSQAQPSLCSLQTFPTTPQSLCSPNARSALSSSLFWSPKHFLHSPPSSSLLWLHRANSRGPGVPWTIVSLGGVGVGQRAGKELLSWLPASPPRCTVWNLPGTLLAAQSSHHPAEAWGGGSPPPPPWNGTGSMWLSWDSPGHPAAHLVLPQVMPGLQRGWRQLSEGFEQRNSMNEAAVQVSSCLFPALRAAAAPGLSYDG